MFQLIVTQCSIIFLTYEDNSLGLSLPFCKVIGNYQIQTKFPCYQYYIRNYPTTKFSDSMLNNG